MTCLLAYLALSFSGLNGSTLSADGDTTVDRSHWIQEMVTLYYFPNAMVLAKTLNPEGTLTTTGTAPAALAGRGENDPKPLAEALGDHIDALNAFERLKQAVKDAEARLTIATNAERLANRKLALATREVAATAPAIAEADDAITAAQELVDEAQAKVDTYKDPPKDSNGMPITETDADRAKRLRDLAMWRARLVARKSSLRTAQQRKNDAELRKTLKEQVQTEAQEDLTAAEEEKTAATAALTSAKTAFANAGTNIGEKARALRSSRAQVQLDAANRLEFFQKQRDNASIWTSLAVQDSKDPVRKVDINVYPDSRTIFLRGLPGDVRQVREIIANFDRPVPQARVTLWTIDLNLIGNKGRNALTGKSTQIESHMTVARDKMAEVGRLFREALTEEVSLVQSTHPALATGDVLDGYRLARCFFYEKEVALQLGLDQSKVQGFPAYYYFTRWTLPDPAASTTLGEAVLIYMLGTVEYRKAVLQGFNSKLLSAHVPPSYVTRFMHELSVGNLNVTGSINSNQAEITRALKRSALDRFIEKSPAVVRMFSDFTSKYFPNLSREFLGSIIPSASGDNRQRLWAENLYSHTTQPNVNAGSDWTHIAAEDQIVAHGIGETMTFMVPAMFWLRQEFGINIQVFGELATKYRIPDNMEANHALAEDIFAANTIKALREAFPTDQSNARIAAADEMLKRIMISLEDDLQEAYVVPALNALKKDLLTPGISVGAVGRTSLIASNRYASRVEGNASAELDLEGQQRLVDAALALSDLFAAAKGSNIPKALQRLQGLDKEPTSDFYAVASGSQFKVTPIFDPTGQALSFQFDHVKNSTILDSDGTNPSLPRIDSHTTSMMVQVSNMEIRELTRFETNVKLGSPEKRWGGIPILKDIYPLSEVPIIGWFSRRSGRDAVSQSSVIFAQNAMYPTIGDLSNLLSSGFGVPPLTGGSRP